MASNRTARRSRRKPMNREQALKALSSATECARVIAEDTKLSASDRIAAAHAVVQACAMYARLEAVPKPPRAIPEKPDVEYLSMDEYKALIGDAGDDLDDDLMYEDD